MRRWCSLLLGVMAVVFTAAAYPPAKPTVGVLSGVTTTCGSLEIVVTGFAPGETVVLTLGSISATLVTAADGSGTVTTGVPNAADTYVLMATGQTSGLVATSSVTLTACTVDPAPPATTAAAGAVRPLPVSGSDVSTPVRIGLAVLALGVGLAAVGYRRRYSRY